MAATAIANPSGFPSGAPSLFSGWPASTHQGTSLMSPPGPRGMTNDIRSDSTPPSMTHPLRQSLPSIQEALSNGPKPSSYSSPITSVPPPHQHPYPSPQATRLHSNSAPQPPQPTDRHTSSPLLHHPPPIPFSQPQPNLTAFPENRPAPVSLQAAPAPPHNPYAAARFEPRFEEAATERMTEYPPNPNGQAPYAHAPVQLIRPQPQDGLYDPSYNARYQGRDSREIPEGKERDTNNKIAIMPAFKQGLKRHLDVWDFENNLAQVSFGLLHGDILSSSNFHHRSM